MNECIERMAIALDEAMYKPERKTDWSLAPAQHHNTCRRLARAAFEVLYPEFERIKSAYSPIGDDVVWIDDRTPLPMFVDSIINSG